MRILAKGIALICVPLVLSAAISASLYTLLLKTDRDRLEQTSNSMASEHSVTAMFALFDLGNAFKDIIANRADRAIHKARFKNDLQTLRREEELLMALDTSETFAGVILNERKQLEYVLSGWAEIFRSLKEQPLATALRTSFFKRQTTELGYSLVSASQSLIGEVLTYLRTRPEEERRLFELQVGILILGVVLSALIGIGFARWFMNEIVFRVKVMVANTVRMTKNEPLAPLVPGSDELTSLDRAFHEMAAALNAAREKEHRLFLNASDLISIIDGDLHFKALNPACQRILGYDPGELVGLYILELVHADDREQSGQLLNQSVSQNSAVTFENRFRHKDGHYVNLEWSACWSESSNELCAVSHDISERKRVQQQKAEFLNVVTHDLRSPLCSISALFEMVSMGVYGDMTAGAQKVTATVRDSVDSLIGLISDLLDLQKLEASKLKLSKRVSDIDAVVDAAVSEVEDTAARRGLAIVVHNESTTAEAQLDPERMTQALSHLLSYAISIAQNNSTIVVRVSTKVDTLEFALAMMAGQEQVPSALECFTPSVQNARPLNSDAAVVLRLQVCNRIIEAHGGSCSSGQQDDGKLVLQVSMPLSNAEKMSPAPVKISQPAAPIMIPERSRPKVPHMRLVHKGLLVVAVPVIFEIAFCCALLNLLVQSYEAEQRELHNRIVATTAQNGALLYYKMAVELNLDKAPPFWERFVKTIDDAVASERELHALTARSPRAHELTGQISAKLEPAHLFFANAKKYVSEHSTSAEDVGTALDHHKGNLDNLPTEVSPLYQQLFDLCSESRTGGPNQSSQLRTAQGLVLLASFCVSVALSILSMVALSTQMTKRLRVMEDNMERMKSGQALNPPVSGTDEIAHLDQFFHAMEQALREAQRREKSVFDNSMDVLCVLTRDGTIKTINPACSRMWSYSAEELTGSNVLSLIEEPFKKGMRNLLGNMSAENAFVDFENVVVSKDGAQCTVDWSLSYSCENDCITAVAHDVSYSAELRQLKAQFVTAVSTEMRSPLEEVRLRTQELLSGNHGPMNAEVADRLESVDESCARLLRLIEDMSRLNESESSDVELRMNEAKVSDLFKRTLVALEAFGQAHKVALEIEDRDEHLMYVDLDKLTQVCVNLVSNAIKFSPPNSVVRLHSDAHGDFVRIYVADQGRGIPAEFQNSIFEKFAQVDDADGKRGTGTGLGLPICKEIVEQHGGELQVQSTPGKGSTFWFSVKANENRPKT